MIVFAWQMSMTVLLLFCVVFAAKLDWRHHPVLAVALFIFGLGVTIPAFLFPPFNLVTFACLLLAAMIFAVWYLVREVMNHFRPPVTPDRRGSPLVKIDQGDMTRTIRSYERRAA